jgi:hypothetical protein
VDLIEEGNKAAWTGIYTATVGVDGLPWAKGLELVIHLAAVTEVDSGFIVRHREYITTPEGGGT